MTLDWTLGSGLLLFDWLIRLAALCWIPARTGPAAARSWLLLVFFLPLLGLPVYLLLGHPWLSRRRLRRQVAASRRIRAQAHEALRWQPDSPLSAHIAALVEQQGSFMPIAGNAAQLLDDYHRALDGLLADIDQADELVHLLYYLLFDDAVGEAVVQALLRAAARGVQCRLMLDAVGAKRGLRAYGQRLREGGVQVLAVLPGGLGWLRSGRLDLRNHRKLAIIDNRVGYIGSQNLALPQFVPGHPNRELVVRLQGPILSSLQAMFASDWYIESGQHLAVPPAPAMAGSSALQLLPGGPAYRYQNARDAVNALIAGARQQVVLVTPYFVPDESTLSALRIAALSGVRVQLILSASNNQLLAALAQQASFDGLLRCGVRIALYQPHFLHAKHLSVDGKVALIGSINLDIRSFALNAELGLLCHDPALVAAVEAVERDYLAHAQVLSLSQWRQRPRWRRSAEGIARLADALI